MTDCLFCKIVSGAIPANEIERTAHALAFADLHPAAPTHVLVVPQRHVANLSEFVATADGAEVGELFGLASSLGKRASPDGYRIVTNEGPHAGQSVFHFHVHVLAGRPMSWPPG